MFTTSDERGNRDDLIKRLREEANTVKDCFTKFAFQGLAFSGVILGFIASGQKENPYISLAGILVTVVLLTVARIGTHKYGTANRNFGFELHLDRTNDNRLESVDGWRKEYRYIGWEEAMRAWRIVQATIYRKIYYTNGIIRKDRPKKPEISYKWYVVTDNLKNNEYEPIYYAGGYLAKMLKILHGMAFIGVVPIFIASLHFLIETIKGLQNKNFSNLFSSYLTSFHSFLGFKFQGINSQTVTETVSKVATQTITKTETITGADIPTSIFCNFTLCVIFFLIGAVTCLYIFWKMRLNIKRRRILEDGLLSIHSCSIVWQAVILAHYKAKEEVIDQNYAGYSQCLGEWAEKICQNLENIHKWIMAPNGNNE